MNKDLEKIKKDSADSKANKYGTEDTSKSISDLMPKVRQTIKTAADKPTGFVLDRPTFDGRYKYHRLAVAHNTNRPLHEISKEDEPVIGLIFKYFLKDPEFLESPLIKSEASFNKGLLIHGPVGVGKSYLFDILHEIGRELITKRRHANIWFRSITAVSFVDLYMQEVTKKDAKQATNFDLKSYYKGQLYIDDLGLEEKAFNRYELFEQLLFERNRSRSITFVTTNLKPTQIGERYGERIGDRLPEMFNIIKWHGESKRK